MSAIPPGWLGSVIQGHGAQQRASETRARETSAEADVARGGPERATDAIEISDRDSEVYEDAEGQGGSRRQGDAEEDDASSRDDSSGDADLAAPVGPGAIDLEA